MQITLNHDEIVGAIEAYVHTLISIPEGMSIAIDMKAGRGENGMSATLDIVPAGNKPTGITGLNVKALEPEEAVEAAPVKATRSSMSFTAPKAVKEADPVKTLKAVVEEPEEAPEAAEEQASEQADEPEQAEEAPVPKRSIFAKATA